jgi:hypothetical protein
LKLLGIIIAGDNGVSIAFFPSVSSAFTARKNIFIEHTDRWIIILFTLKNTRLSTLFVAIAVLFHYEIFTKLNGSFGKFQWN